MMYLRLCIILFSFSSCQYKSPNDKQLDYNTIANPDTTIYVGDTVSGYKLYIKGNDTTIMDCGVNPDWKGDSK